MVSATLITLGGETCILAQSSDITERKRAEEALRESEERFSTVFRLSPVAISIVRAADGRFVDVNDVFVKTSGYTREEIVGRTSDQLELWANPENHAAKIRELDEHNAVDTFEFKARTKSGEIKIGLAATAPIDLGGEKHFLSLIHDITDRKSAEETLRQQGAALEAAANGIVITDRQGVIRWVNPAFTRLTGFTAEESIGQNPRIWQSGKHDGAFFKNLWDTILAGQVWRGEIINRRKDGSLYTEEMTITPVRQVEGEITHFIAIKQNISERKQHEDEREAIIRISNALRTSPTRSEMLPVLLDQLNDLFHSDGATLAMQDPVTGEIVIELGRSIVGRNFTGARLAPGQGVSALVIASGKPYLNNDVRNDPRFVPLDQLGEAHAVACAPLITQDHTIGALWIVRQSSITENELRLLVAIADIAANASHRTTLHEQTEQQLRRLTALHQIDNAISASLDLHIILNVLLNNSVALLGADAADILLYDPYTQTLSYAAGCGFRTRNIEYSQVRLGQGQAGTAALERRVIALPDMDQADIAFKLAALLADEGFVSHFCAPLIAKGQIKGVIEVFHRARLDPPAGWLDFLETLATQAAIAIDNATLFDHLQRSNLELKLAYDATIEGWSRALDLRDKETEGHTQRVAEMSVRLARSLGMRDEELIQVRRGALLHDIGKMGIPDRILLKGGSLTEQEWDIMRRHPTYAYELIAPIAFLRAALDIPYCHHEKWDGSGYPRGLKGEQIPLAARIFAIVDVWDALRSDRPYRQGWSETKVREHIRANSGTHFDPQVVETFMRMLEEK
ncbi:MAG: PAS domain S-box protein [Chloroflexi bacterium]|nr:PAS domain S-box protein [Chloroflexota bacterium]